MTDTGKDLAQSNMNSITERPRVELYNDCGVTAELRKTMHRDRGMPPHFHDEYQIILGTHALIEYRYRRAPKRAPIGTLFVAEPGEVHSAEVMENTSIWEPLRTFLIAPSKVSALLDDEKASRTLPYFKSPIIEDRNTFLSMVRLHRLLTCEPAGLVKDTILLTTFRSFFAGTKMLPERTPLRSSARISRVREFIDAHHAESITLDRLSAVAGLSPFHLVRAFKSAYGLPPHAYQIQVRVIKARALLLDGFTAVQAAAMTGFADQAHFARHFVRLMGVSPGRYRAQRARTFKTAE
jgi:AraC-like DNA-binding protein